MVKIDRIVERIAKHISKIIPIGHVLLGPQNVKSTKIHKKQTNKKESTKDLQKIHKISAKQKIYQKYTEIYTGI